MEKQQDTLVPAQDGDPKSKVMVNEDVATIETPEGDPLEDLEIDFLLEEVENKIAPLALA